ncbi:MAG: tripartite tricarboxylate transporter TctB family protein [Pikeienuella sp.]
MTTRPWMRSHFVAGIAGMLIGAFAIWESWDYPMGSATRMGPGYFPLLLGGALILASLGVLIFEGRLSPGRDIHAPAFRGLIWVPLAVAAFALLVERSGMIPAVAAAVFLSAQADDSLGWRETALLALGTAGVCTVIFIFILGLPLAPIGI